MKLSVVILNYNVRYFLELCLKSVEKAVENIDAEIIVVDNNSSDDSCAMVKSTFPNIKLIENTTNFGFSKGNNIGVKKAKGNFVCILNPDTVVAEDTFIRVLRFAEQNEDLGMVGCRLIDGKGNFLPESKRNIPIAKVALQKMMGNSKYYYATQLDQLEEGKVDVLVGAFMLMKREVYNEVGGFDEDYFMYGEDIDLSYKILKAGYQNYYFGKSSIVHFKGESTLKDKRYAKRFFGAMQIFYRKHFKKNLLFDAVVWIGIKLAYIFRRQAKIILSKPETYVVISNNKEHPVLNKLKKSILVVQELENVEANSEVIFDASFYSYSQIIESMSILAANRSTTFKIIPNGSRFMLGSNNSKNQGEVILF